MLQFWHASSQICFTTGIQKVLDKVASSIQRKIDLNHISISNKVLLCIAKCLECNIYIGREEECINKDIEQLKETRKGSRKN